MMKALIASLTVFLFAFHLSAQSDGIVWEKDFEKAQALARETGRPMLVDFTAPWCKPCNAMDKEFWALPEVISATKPFVAVKIDFDKQTNIVGKYKVAAIPYVAFADPLGNLVTFRRGFGKKNVAELNQILSLMPKDFSSVMKYCERLEVNKDDGEALLQIADFYSKAQMLTLGCDFYIKALKTDEIKADAAKRERVIAVIGANYYAANADAPAVDFLSDYLKDYPEGKNREISLAMIAISSFNLGKLNEANKYFEALKTNFPASKNIAVVKKAIEEQKNKLDKK